MLDGKWRVFLVATTLTLMVGTASAQKHGFFHLNETSGSTVYDYSGLNNDGTINNQIIQGVTGVSLYDGLAYEWDGGSDDDDHISFSTSFTPTNITLAGFVYPTDVGADRHRVLVSNNGNNHWQNGLWIGTGGSFAYDIYDSSSGNPTVVKTGSANTNEWYCMVGGYRHDTGEITIKVYQNGSKISSNSVSVSHSFVSQKEWHIGNWIGGGNDEFNGKIDEPLVTTDYFSDSEAKTYCSTNQAPSVDSVSTEPQSWTLGSDVNVSANVSDDSSVSSVSGKWLYENGSQFDSFSMNNTGGTTWEADNTGPISVKDENVTLKLTATDDSGSTDTYKTSQLIQDNPGSIAINQPTGNIFDYDVKYSISHSDNDDVANENITCDVAWNGTYLIPDKTITFSEDSTTSGTFRIGVGDHTMEMQCSDDAGNTDTASQNYRVEDFRIQNVYSPSQVYETESVDYDFDYRTGDMVNKYGGGLDLYWNGSKRSEFLFPPVDSTDSRTVLKEISLVSSNNTQVQWRFQARYNASTVDGGWEIRTENSSLQSQEILWSYWIENADTNPENGKYIETENLKHEVEIGTETKKAEISGTTQYSRNSETDQMKVTEDTSSSTTLQGNIDVGKANTFNHSTFQTSSDVQIRFNEQTRTLSTAQDNVEVYRIQLFGQANPGSLTTSKALTFDVKYEETGAEVNTRLTMDLSVWKNRKEKIRRFKFQKKPASKHSFHIYPAWANYNIRTLPYPDQTKFDLIQYWNDGKNFVRRSYFFPVTQTLNNETTTLPLRTLNLSESTRIDFEILTSEGNPASNVYCRVDRKFGGGSFSTVFMIKTGSQGRGQSFAEVNEIYYSFTCYKNGEVIETFPSQIMQNPMVLTLGQQQIETVLDYQNTFDASCTYNETQISCDYQSQSEKMSEAQLTVERLEAVKNIRVCSKNSSTITGELACNQLNTTKNDYRYRVEGVYPGATITGAAGQTGVDNSGLGAGGLILTIFIFMFVFAATSFNVPLGIAAGTFSLLITETVGLWVLTPTMRASLIAVALIAGLVARR